MKDQIVKIIAEYLEKNTEHIWHSQGERMAFSKPCEYQVFSEQSFLQEIAAEIAGKMEGVLQPKSKCHEDLELKYARAMRESPKK